MDTENTISKTKNLLLILPNAQEDTHDLRFLQTHFCGRVVHNPADIHEHPSEGRIYACGDFALTETNDLNLSIIPELSSNYEDRDPEKTEIVPLGRVPVMVSNAGVYFRQLFEGDDFFDRIKTEHAFQDLTESTKPGIAFRKGIYLTEVSKETTEAHDEILHFHLLRCSSNLSGPTDNFRATDRLIMSAINAAAKSVFERETRLNHVLAQIYENKSRSSAGEKETKAKIKAHSDKTKDMPEDALIAFCTFYDSAHSQHLKPSATDRYDLCYKQTSALTRLHFKLKNAVNDPALEKEFTVTLYPNSVFFIPLSTNRLYTHEIRPSMLDADKIPTRLGYVARCSKAEAIFKDARTYLKEEGAFVPLEEMTPETMARLKDSYWQENTTENKIQYEVVHFSMNRGDYQQPIY